MPRYNLRTETEADMTAALIAAGVLIESEEGKPAEGVTLDIIGTIYRDTGPTDAEGNPTMEAQKGWHANLIADLMPEKESLLPIIPAPNNPYRIFAGEEA